MRTNTNQSSERLETAGAWPRIVAALADASVQEVAAQFEVPAASIQAALRRTTPGRTRRVARPAPVEVPADEPLPPEPDDVSPKKSTRKSKPLPTDAKIEPFRDELGTISDDAVAKKAGVSKWVVRGFRIRQGIPAYDRWAGHEPKNRRRSNSRRSNGPLLEHVWHVRFADGSERFAVADDLVEAARIAASHGDHPVTGIERLGPDLES